MPSPVERLEQRIKTLKAKGRDTSYLENVLQNHKNGASRPEALLDIEQALSRIARGLPG